EDGIRDFHVTGVQTCALPILVVGWLSLFAWAVYYKVFQPTNSLLTKLHIWSALLGSIGLTVGMWLYVLKPFDLPTGFTLVFYIGGGGILLGSFILFFLLTIISKEK